MEQVVEISNEIEKEVADQEITDLSIEILGKIGGGTGIIDIKL